MNKVLLTGRIVNDPELKQTQSGVSVFTNTIAVKRNTKDEKGEYQSDFIPFTAWRQSAEYLGSYARKGDLIEICGRWQVRNWKDQNGNNRRADEVLVEDVKILQSKQQSQTATPALEDVADDDGFPF